MMDPHLYFETKYTAGINAATSDRQVLEYIDELTDWLATAGLTPRQLAQLEHDLAAQRYPSISLFRSPHRPAALALLHEDICDETEVRELESVIRDEHAAPADRSLAEDRLAPQ